MSCLMCSAPTSNSCSGCHTLFCSVECQRTAWPAHRSCCRTEKYDFRANRFSSKPPACWRCRAPAVDRCSECYEAFYCSIECQHADWRTHRKTCSTDTGRQYTRLLVLGNTEAETHFAILHRTECPALLDQIFKAAVTRQLYVPGEISIYSTAGGQPLTLPGAAILLNALNAPRNLTAPVVLEFGRWAIDHYTDSLRLASTWYDTVLRGDETTKMTLARLLRRAHIKQRAGKVALLAITQKPNQEPTQE